MATAQEDFEKYVQSQPPLLPATVARVLMHQADPSKDGRPTLPTLADELARNNWYKNTVVDLSTRLTTVKSQTDNNTASITTETIARTTADEALAAQITNISTTVGNHTATLTQYGISINGIGVEWGVRGTIDGSSGGFVFQGVRQLGGGATYSLTVNANMIINGDLMVTGTINNRTITDGAVTRLASTYQHTSGTATLVANFRQNAMARVDVMLSEMEATTRYVNPGIGFMTPQVRAWDVYFDGTKIGTVTSIESAIGYTKTSSEYFLYFACTPVTRSYAWGPVGAGNHTIQVVNTSGNSVGITIIVTEHAK